MIADCKVLRERLHQALAYKTPGEAFGAGPVELMDNAIALPTTPRAQQQQEEDDSMKQGELVTSPWSPHLRRVESGIRVGGSLT